MAGDHRKHNQCETPPPARLGQGPKLIHQSLVQTMFIQLLLTLQLFTVADERPNKDGEDGRGAARQRHSFSSHQGLAIGKQGDCLSVLQGGIYYTHYLKGPLWSSRRRTKGANVPAPQVACVILFYVLPSNFLFRLILFCSRCQNLDFGV